MLVETDWNYVALSTYAEAAAASLGVAWSCLPGHWGVTASINHKDSRLSFTVSVDNDGDLTITNQATDQARYLPDLSAADDDDVIAQAIAACIRKEAAPWLDGCPQHGFACEPDDHIEPPTVDGMVI